MTKAADAVIVGAGVIGCAVAFELTKAGYRTINVDRLGGAGYGSTSSSSSIVRAHYSSRDGVAMAFEGFSYWQDWSNYLESFDERGTATYVQCGSVLLKSDDGLHLKAGNHYRQLGVPHEDWDTAELKHRIPYYDVRRFGPPSRPDDDRFWQEPDTELTGAIYTPGSGYVDDPQLATHNLQVAAEAKGAEFCFRRGVVGILGDSDVTGVALDDGSSIHAPIVVNVAGPHSSQLNRLAGVEAGMSIRTRPMRHEVHVVPAPAAMTPPNSSFHTADGDLGIYFRPSGGATLIVGGEDPACDPREWVDDPDRFERGPTRSHWEAQVFRLARRIPELQVPPTARGLADLYDVSDDWIPIYDRSDRPGYFMAVGTSGNQFKNAPIAGYLMAQLIHRCVNGSRHDDKPEVVLGPHTGLSIDVGSFSRLRQPAAESSFSVNG